MNSHRSHGHSPCSVHFRSHIAHDHRVKLPRSLRSELAVPVDELARAAQSRYRNHDKKAETAAPRGASQRRMRIEDVARSVGEVKALRKIVKRLQKTDPKLASMIGW